MRNIFKLILLIFAGYLGWIFISASLDKIVNPHQFLKSINNYEITPYWVNSLAALVLPWVELICGFLLVAGLFLYFKNGSDLIDIPKKIFIRFHIHPDVRLNVTTSKKKVFLQLKNNIAWEFICSEAKIKLKEGIYLGAKKTIQKNNHILISENLVPEKKIKWMFRLIK